MRKIIFLLILSFPTTAFGQNYAGNYRAVFFNLLAEPRSIVVEFEVKPDNSMSGTASIGNEIKTFSGAADKNGKFEAVSPIEGNLTYKLKGKFDKNNKISFIRRIVEKSSGSKSVSENGLEGSFEKVAKPQPPSRFPISDNGKTQIRFHHPKPLFGQEQSELPATVSSFNYKDTKMKELFVKMKSNNLDIDTEQTFSFGLLFEQDGQKVWNGGYAMTDIDYFESNSVGSNAFSASGGDDIKSGKIEIVSENEKQIVFKITNLQLQKISGDDFVQIDGYIYADKIVTQNNRGLIFKKL